MSEGGVTSHFMGKVFGKSGKLRNGELRNVAGLRCAACAAS